MLGQLNDISCSPYPAFMMHSKGGKIRKCPPQKEYYQVDDGMEKGEAKEKQSIGYCYLFKPLPKHIA